jgi:hypothetical protein
MASQAIARVRHRNAARSFQLKANYGISLEDYQRMLERQGGVCAICKKKSDETLCVDHCPSHAQIALAALPQVQYRARMLQ